MRSDLKGKNPLEIRVILEHERLLKRARAKADRDAKIYQKISKMAEAEKQRKIARMMKIKPAKDFIIWKNNKILGSKNGVKGIDFTKNNTSYKGYNTLFLRTKLLTFKEFQGSIKHNFRLDKASFNNVKVEFLPEKMLENEDAKSILKANFDIFKDVENEVLRLKKGSAEVFLKARNTKKGKEILSKDIPFLTEQVISLPETFFQLSKEDMDKMTSEIKNWRVKRNKELGLFSPENIILNYHGDENNPHFHIIFCGVRNSIKDQKTLLTRDKKGALNMSWLREPEIFEKEQKELAGLISKYKNIEVALRKKKFVSEIKNKNDWKDVNLEKKKDVFSYKKSKEAKDNFLAKKQYIENVNVEYEKAKSLNNTYKKLNDEIYNENKKIIGELLGVDVGGNKIKELKAKYKVNNTSLLVKKIVEDVKRQANIEFVNKKEKFNDDVKKLNDEKEKLKRKALDFESMVKQKIDDLDREELLLLKNKNTEYTR